MREFYTLYPISQMASGKLSWSHYVELLAVSDKDARSFYEQECVNAKWSVKELNRQIGTSLFERLLLSDSKGSRKKVLALAKRGSSGTSKNFCWNLGAGSCSWEVSSG